MRFIVSPSCSQFKPQQRQTEPKQMAHDETIASARRSSILHGHGLGARAETPHTQKRHRTFACETAGARSRVSYVTHHITPVHMTLMVLEASGGRAHSTERRRDNQRNRGSRHRRRCDARTQMCVRGECACVLPPWRSPLGVFPTGKHAHVARGARVTCVCARVRA